MLRRREFSFYDVIFREETPEHILHEFACDCAERALWQIHFAGRETDVRSWKVLRLKRLWLQKEVGHGELQEAQEEARNVARQAWDGSWGGADLDRESAHAASRAARAATIIARLAAFDTLSVGVIEEGDTWYASHLADLLDLFAEEREKIIEALRSRQRQLRALPRWQQELEEGLLED